MLAYYNCLYNDVETLQINYNFIDNNQIKVKYEINVKNNDGKIKTFYNWLNHTPKTDDNLCVYPIDVISNNIVETTQDMDLFMKLSINKESNTDLKMKTTIK
jgi:hypothetical protein